MKIRWPSALEPPGNVGGRRQGSNQGIAMSSQPAVVEEEGSVDLR